MTPERGFVLFLVLTLALLGAVVATGYAERRRTHIACVALTLAALGTTIWFAERMGEHYDLATAGAITPVHLWLAKVTTLAYLAPIATGVLTIRDDRWKTWHRRCAFAVLGLTVATAITGTWMVLAAERLPAVSGS
jgi:cytosine/uracil/thiamine/allantoin permease